MRTIWVGILPPRANRLHVHRRRWRLVNRLIRVTDERGRAFAAPSTTASVHTATHDRGNEDQAPHKDVRPIACYRALDVLFLLGGRNWGVRLLRGREENIRGGALRAVQANTNEVGERGGRIG